MSTATEMKVEIAGTLSCVSRFDAASGLTSLSFDEYSFESGWVALLDNDNEIEWGNSLDDLRKKITEKTMAPAQKSKGLGAIDSCIAAQERTYFPMPTGYSRDEIEAYSHQQREERKLRLISHYEQSGKPWIIETLKKDYGVEVKVTVELVEPTEAPEAEAA